MAIPPSLTELVSGLGFVEGPVWTGDRLVVTSITKGRLYEVALDGSAWREMAEPGGGPNGLALSDDGSFWIGQGGGGHFGMPSESLRPPGIQRWTGGELSDPVNKLVTAPSDCAIGPDGRLWFTDPPTTFETTSPGGIVTYDPSTGATTRVSSDEHYPERFYPNGLAFGIDAATLYVADSVNKRILSYDVANGGLSAPKVFVERCSGLPDGMAVDADGNLYVAMMTTHTIAIYDREGVLVDDLKVDKCRPTNMCFAGDDLRTLVITAAAGGRVLKTPVVVPGLPLHTRLRA